MTMKQKTLLALALALVMATAYAQDTMYVCLKSGDVMTILVDDVDSIIYYNPIAQPGCPDDNHPHAIDLGLPSGTKWACCNIGCSKPEDCGDYFAWGETDTKSFYDIYSYKYRADGSFTDIGSDIAGTDYDVAHAKWGGSWTMPTADQMQELGANCTWTWQDEDSTAGLTAGYKVTAKNGASILFPATGFVDHNEEKCKGTEGYYWMATSENTTTLSTSDILWFDSSEYDDASIQTRFSGCAVRAVCK